MDIPRNHVPAGDHRVRLSINGNDVVMGLADWQTLVGVVRQADDDLKAHLTFVPS